MTNYILSGKTPIPCNDYEQFAAWFATVDRTVDRTVIHGYTVSTVFLGLDHQWLSDAEPLLFESMIFCPFDPSLDQQMQRYSTWETAEAGHRAIVRLICKLPWYRQLWLRRGDR